MRRTGYNTRRLPLSSYRNKLWESSRFKTHYRSQIGLVATINTASAPTTMQVAFQPAWGGNIVAGGSVASFYQPAGGVREVGTNAFPESSDITIRGGRWGRRYYNSGTVTVRLERWEIYFKPNQPTIPVPAGEVSFFETVGWDPTYVEDFQQKFTVGRKIVTSIEPGDTFTMENKVPIAKIDQGIWEAGGQRAWVYETFNSANVGSVPVIITQWHSISFVADRDQEGD